MAKFEPIVRPVVFPNIRPTQARSVLPEDDPLEGFAVINGSGGGFVDLAYTFTHQITRQRPRETKRRVDVVRVYQKEEDGTVNRENFIDVEVADKLWMKESGEGGSLFDKTTGAPIPGGKSADVESSANYKRIEEDDNIEYIKEQIIRKNPAERNR